MERDPEASPWPTPADSPLRTCLRRRARQTLGLDHVRVDHAGGELEQQTQIRLADHAVKGKAPVRVLSCRSRSASRW